MLSMSMSVGQSLRTEVSQRQELRLAQEARQARQLSLRIDLLQAVRGDHYQPKAQCPACGHKLSDLEILKGFNDSPTDTTTGCPTCRTRFQPYLVCHLSSAVRVELPFYCSSQTIAQLRGQETKTPEQLELEAPAVYRSTIFHYGSLATAFRLVGVTYTLEPVQPAWHDKVPPFLGRLSDRVIAECVGVPVLDIRKLRCRLGISGYRTRARRHIHG